MGLGEEYGDSRDGMEREGGMEGGEGRWRWKMEMEMETGMMEIEVGVKVERGVQMECSCPCPRYILGEAEVDAFGV